MALESFYGGKPGVSPVIKARFKYVDTKDPAYTAKTNSGPQQLTEEEANWLNDTFGTTEYTKNLWVQWVGNGGTSLADVNISTINEQNPLSTSLAPFTMEECLKDINYTNVWYGELCIIDTDSKLNPNNGKIYRRTLKYGSSGASATGYAEYVGQIVGPSGGIPQFHIGSLDEERKKAVGAESTYEGETISSNNNWQYSYIESERENLTSEIPDNFEDIAVLNANNENSANIQMVPGKETIKNNDNTETIKYHDNIRYTWCNVRRKLDGDNTEDAWIYLGFEIPYTTFEVTGALEDFTYAGDLLEDNSSNNHPFHKDYVFHIPRGARGIGPEEIFIVGKDSKTKPNPLYDFDAIEYDNEHDTYSVNSNKIISPSKSTYWVAKWKLYNPKTGITEPTSVYQYLGAYKDISNVILHHGQTIGQTDYNNDGTVEVCYSDGSSISFNQALTWITNATLDTNPEKIEIQNGQEVEVNNPDYGTFTLTFNNNKVSPITKNLHLIKNASYDAATGEITFDYSGGISQTVGTIQYISKMKVNNDGDLLYQYNTDDMTDQDLWKNIKNESNNNFRIKDIKAMHVTDYGQLEVLYRGDTIWSNLGQTNNVVNTGPVCILENSDQNSVDGIFLTRNDALDQLIDSTYDNNSTYPRIDGDTGTIKIKINGEEIDASGGLVGAKVSNSNISENDIISEDNSEDYYIALYWYDPNLDSNSNPKGWIYVGTIGSGIDQNYEVYISKEEKDEQENIITTVVPDANVENAAISFQAKLEDFSTEGKEEAIGFLPWEKTIKETSNGEETSDEEEISDGGENGD